MCRLLGLFTLLLLCSCQLTTVTSTFTLPAPSLTSTKSLKIPIETITPTRTPLDSANTTVIPVSPFSQNPPRIPSQSSVKLEHIQFIDQKNGWAWGYSYDEAHQTHWTILLSTTDGGVTWEVNPLPDAAYFHFSALPDKIIINDFKFLDASFAWAGTKESVIGDAGMIGVYESANFYTSRNGGKSWTAQQSSFPTLPPLPETQSDWRIRRKDCAIAQNTNAVECEFHIWYKSFGADWQTSYRILNSEAQFWTTHATSKTGWLLYNHKPDNSSKFVSAIVKTEDGGQTWQELPTPPIEPSFYTLGKSLVAMHATSENILWLATGHSLTGTEGTKAIYVSEDGGTTWELRAKVGLNPNENVGNISQSGYIVNFFANSESTAFFGIGGLGGLLGSFNGGRSWKGILSNTVALHADELFFIDAQSGWLLAQDTILRTNDGGKTWQSAERVPGLSNFIVPTPTPTLVKTPYPIQATPHPILGYP